MQSDSRDATGLLRTVGGISLVAGAVALYIRKGTHHLWGEVALLLLILIPALLMFTLAVGDAREHKDSADDESWRSVLMVLSILLGPLALAQLLKLLGANTANALWTAWILAFTGVTAACGARLARAPYAMLLAGLALLTAWVIAWGKILNHPTADAFRLVLIGGAALLFIAATRLRAGKAIGSAEVATVGGIAAVAAGTIGVVLGTFESVFQPISRMIASSRAAGGHAIGLTSTNGFQHFGWDLYLLVVSGGLIWLGSRARARGLGYVGGFGLLVFIYSIGIELTRLESGKPSSASIMGWPLLLLALGLVGLIVPAFSRRNA